MTKRRSPTADSPVQVFLHTARQRWLTANEAEADNRKEGLTDLQFLNLDQWPPEIRKARDTPGQERPCLTIDQIGEPYRQLTNKVRQARSSIRILPEDGEANKKTAERLQELIRGIEYASDAQIAYVTAFEGAVGPGWGYARIRGEYEDATASRDQVIKIDAIENQFSTWIDPAAKEPDRRDMRFAFVAEAMPTDAYTDKYGESMAATGSRELFQGIGANWQDWFPEGRIIVAEYYYRDDDSVILVELDNGMVLKKSEAPKELKIVEEWTATTPIVKWAKINGLEILEGNEEKTAGRRIPGTTIPIRPCFGQQLNVDGKRVVRGLVRAARDPQQMYNYNNSALVEDLALVPKTKMLLAEGQEEGHELELQQSLNAPTPYIRYKPTSLGDKLVPAPSVTQFTDPSKIQSLVIAINQNKADLRSTLSFYDPSDPSRKNTDQSGKAILARKAELDQGNTGYLENYSRFLTSMGKLLLEWIPEIYDRPGRVMRGMDLEDNPTFMMLNQPYRKNHEGLPEAVDPTAMALGGGQNAYEHIDLTKGAYGVKVTVGASYLTMRQEAAENGLKLMEVLPTQAPSFADVVVRNLDGPGNEEIADRLKRQLPPQITGGEDRSHESNPEQLQAAIAQAKQKEQEMLTVIRGLQEAIKIDQAKIEGELAKVQTSAQAEGQQAQRSDAVKIRIAEMDNETKLLLEDKKIAADLALARLKIEADFDKTAMATVVSEDGAPDGRGAEA